VRAYVRTDDDLAATIRQEVLLKILWLDPELFTVVVKDGVASISGRVERRSTAEMVERSVRMVPGVVDVHASVSWSMDDKAVSEIAKILFTKADKLILTRAENSRAMPADKIRDIVPQDILPDENVFVTDTVDAALAKANTISGAEEVIVITGSLYLVGELRRILLRRNR